MKQLTRLCEQYRTDSRYNSYLHCAANDGKKKKEGVPQAIAAMRAAGGSIEYVTKHDLNQVVENRPHQVDTGSSQGDTQDWESFLGQLHVLLPALVVA